MGLHFSDAKYLLVKRICVKGIHQNLLSPLKVMLTQINIPGLMQIELIIARNKFKFF